LDDKELGILFEHERILQKEKRDKQKARKFLPCLTPLFPISLPASFNPPILYFRIVFHLIDISHPFLHKQIPSQILVQVLTMKKMREMMKKKRKLMRNKLKETRRKKLKRKLKLTLMPMLTLVPILMRTPATRLKCAQSKRSSYRWRRWIR
jgi:hypothetical protein